MSRLLCAYFAPDCPSSTGLIYYILAYMSTRAELSAQQAAAHPRGPSRPPADTSNRAPTGPARPF